MPRFLIFSDLHAHPFRAFSKLDEDGTNTRLLTTVRALEGICGLARDFRVEAVLCLGDLFHVSAPPSRAKNLIWKAIDEGLVQHGIHLYLLPGNHDIGHKEYGHWMDVSFASFRRPLVHPILPPGRFEFLDIFGVRTLAVPYCTQESVVEILGKAAQAGKSDLLIMHSEVAGANIGSYNFVGPLTPGRIATAADRAFVGHIHRPHRFNGNVIVPGAPLHHDFGDQGDRSVWLLDMEREKVKEIPQHFPRFVTVESEGELPIPAARMHYYRVAGPPAEQESIIVDLPEDEGVIRAFSKGKAKASVGLEFWKQAKAKSKSTLTPRPLALELVAIENFLIWRELTLRFDFPSYLIYGLNGSGKTSIFEAVYWALYGKTTKQLPKADVINWAAKSCRVTVNLRDGDSVWTISRRRTADGESVAITPPVGQRITGSLVSMQKQIISLIGVDADLFLQLVYFAQKGVPLFGDLSDAPRKNIISSILDLGIWETARDLVRTEVRSGQAALADLKGKLRDAEVRIGETEQLLGRSEASRLEWVETRKVQIDSRQAILRKQKKALAELKAELKSAVSAAVVVAKKCASAEAAAEEIEEKYQAAVAKHRDLLAKVAEVARDLRRLQEHCRSVEQQEPGTRCSVCGMVIDAVHLSTYGKEAKARVEELRRAVNKQKDRAKAFPLSEIEEVWNRARQDKASLAQQWEKAQAIEAQHSRKLVAVQAGATAEQKRLVEFKREACPYDRMIREDGAKLKELCGLQRGLDEQVTSGDETLSELDFWFQAFGPEGVPARLLDGFCTTVTKHVNEQLEFVGSKVRVLVKAQRATKSGSVRNRITLLNMTDGKERPFLSLSGGEQSLLNLLLMITLQRVLRSRYALPECVFGIQLFDEILGDLDSVVLGGVKRLIENLPVRSALIVTHDERLRQHFDAAFEVKEEGGSAILSSVSAT